MTNSNDFAFATPDSGTEFATTWEGQRGLTKREYFAAMAMQGLLANHGCGLLGDYVKEAVYYADILIQELNK